MVHNTIPDGITNASALPNLKFYGNLITSASGSLAVDIKESFTDANGADSDPSSIRKYDNYLSGGGITAKDFAGITNMGGVDGSDLFSNVAEHNFSSLIAGAGVNDANLTHLSKLADDYAINVASTGWQHDHVHTTDTIIKNIPNAIFDRGTYYIGDSTVEEGHKALYLKIKDSDGAWLYDKLGAIDTDNGATSVDWSSISSTITKEYDFDNVDVSKCDDCRGAYVFELIPPHEWFEEHRMILHYTAEGKNTLQGDI